MIQIITDSTCDLSKEQQQQLGIHVIPMKVLFGETEYTEGVTITRDEFYDKLEQSEDLPMTTQVNPAEFVSCFEEYLEKGDEVVAILVSSKLSGTYQSAVIAKEMLDSDAIHLIDSMNVTLGLALLIIEAVKLRDSGVSAKEIVATIEALKERVSLVAIVDTLKYLKKGGRLSSTAAILGTALGINPIVQVKDGLVTMLGKERGKKKTHRFVQEYITNHPICNQHSIVFAHARAMEQLEEFKDSVSDSCKDLPQQDVYIGCVVGTHVGPGAVGLAYIRK